MPHRLTTKLVESVHIKPMECALEHAVGWQPRSLKTCRIGVPGRKGSCKMCGIRANTRRRGKEAGLAAFVEQA